jgi:hypothetical protein
MRHNYLLPILIPFLIWALFVFFLFKPAMVYLAVVLSVCLILFSVRQFIVASISKDKWWNFIIFPIFFLLSIAAYSTIVGSKIIIHLLFLVNAVFLYFYLRSAYYYFIFPPKYKNLTFEMISSFGNFLAFFFFVSFIYDLESALNLPAWPLMLMITLVSALMIYQGFWASGLKSNLNFLYIIIGALVLLELAWSISFLPLNFNIAGLILAICYYMITGLTKFHLSDKLDKKIIKTYLISGLASIFLILLTARWI